jgi:hypothetical protein
MRSLKTIKFLHFGLEFVSSRVLKPIFGNQLKKLIFNDCVWDHTSDVPVSVFMESIDAAFSPPLFEPRFTTNRFTPAIATLWDSGKHSDLKIVGGFPGQQDTFSSHKFIVESQSDIFKTAFEVCNSTAPEVITIDDFQSEIIRGMLNWIYTDAIQEEVDAFELYRIAEKYNIEALMRRSKEIILSKISPLTVIKIMQFGNVHTFTRIKEEAVKFNQGISPSKQIPQHLINDVNTLEEIVNSHLVSKGAKEKSFVLKRKLDG